MRWRRKRSAVAPAGPLCEVPQNRNPSRSPELSEASGLAVVPVIVCTRKRPYTKFRLRTASKLTAKQGRSFAKSYGVTVSITLRHLFLFANHRGGEQT